MGDDDVGGNNTVASLSMENMIPLNTTKDNRGFPLNKKLMENIVLQKPDDHNNNDWRYNKSIRRTNVKRLINNRYDNNRNFGKKKISEWKTFNNKKPNFSMDEN